MSIQTELLQKIQTEAARIGVIGLGYVGLPLAVRAGRVGFGVLGFDVSEAKVGQINAGASAQISRLEIGFSRISKAIDFISWYFWLIGTPSYSRR